MRLKGGEMASDRKMCFVCGVEVNVMVGDMRSCIGWMESFETLLVSHNRRNLGCNDAMMICERHEHLMAWGGVRYCLDFLNKNSVSQ